VSINVKAAIDPATRRHTWYAVGWPVPSFKYGGFQFIRMLLPSRDSVSVSISRARPVLISSSRHFPCWHVSAVRLGFEKIASDSSRLWPTVLFDPHCESIDCD